MTDEPLFRDAESCVKFAFAICEASMCAAPAYLKVLVRETTKRTRRALGMSQLDWQAQGVMIRRRIADLDPMLVAYVWANYSRGVERETAVQMISGYVASSLGSVRNQPLLAMLVRRHADHIRAHRASIAKIAKESGCSEDWAKEVDIRVRKILADLHSGAFDRLDQQFTDAGMIVHPEGMPLVGC